MSDISILDLYAPPPEVNIDTYTPEMVNFLLSDRFFTWCYESDDFVNCIDITVPSLRAVLSQSRSEDEFYDKAQIALSTLTNRIKNGVTTRVEPYEPYSKPKKNQFFIYVSILIPNHNEGAFICQTVELKKPHNWLVLDR